MSARRAEDGMELVDLLMRTVEKKGSDLFLIPGAPATAKVGARWWPFRRKR